MIQGWHFNDYLILLQDQAEAVQWAEQYDLVSYLPEFTVMGLKNWDSFILQDMNQQFFTIPTVPLDTKYLKPFTWDIDPTQLRADPQVAGKIKWRTKPIVFGGHPRDESNTSWITPEEHVEAVKYWNQMYMQQKEGNSAA